MSENPPVAIPIVSTNTSSTNTVSIEEAQLYENDPPINILRKMEDDMILRRMQVTMMETEIEEYLKNEIFCRARIVKIISIIDIIFLTLNLVSSIILKNMYFIFSCLCPLCICGYYGAKNYEQKYILGYIFYLFLMNIYYLLNALQYTSFVIILILIIEIYFLFYTCRLYNCLHRAKEETIDALKNEWNPLTTVLYYY